MNIAQVASTLTFGVTEKKLEYFGEDGLFSEMEYDFRFTVGARGLGAVSYRIPSNRTLHCTQFFPLGYREQQVTKRRAHYPGTGTLAMLGTVLWLQEKAIVHSADRFVYENPSPQARQFLEKLGLEVLLADQSTASIREVLSSCRGYLRGKHVDTKGFERKARAQAK